jgi:hypothetical protein
MTKKTVIQGRDAAAQLEGLRRAVNRDSYKNL